MKTGDMSLRHLWAAVLANLLVKSFHTLPRAIVVTTTTAGPWAILAAGAIALGLFWPVAAALARRPGQNLIDLALEAGGRPLAIITALTLGAFLVGSVGIELRQISEMAVTAIYPHTPQTFMMASMTLVSALGAAMSTAGLAWMGTIYAWPALYSILVILVGNLGWGQFRHVLPPTGPGLLPVAGELLPLTSHFGELIYLFIFSTYLNTPRHLPRAAAQITALAAAVWAAVVLVYIMVFSIPGGFSMPFPLLEMTRLVQGGRFLERMDTIWIGLWTFGMAGVTAGGLMGTAVLLRDAFRLPDHRGAVLPLAVATLAVALFPANQAGAIAAETFLLRRWGFLVAPGVPLLVALLARLRRGGARG